MTQAEQNEARALWDELHAQYTKASSRNAWLAENQADPDWDELDRRAARSDAKLGRLRDALAEWAGVSVDVVCLLLAAVVTVEEEA